MGVELVEILAERLVVCFILIKAELLALVLLLPDLIIDTLKPGQNCIQRLTLA